MRPQPRYQPGDKIGGRYQIHQALMGGMGEVYLCLDLKETLPYALKTFQQRYQTGTQRLRQAFEKEVATWVALEKHPNIVRCFYLQTLDNQPFMILEWIAGEEGKGTDLRGWLRHGPLDLQLALDLSIDVCRGLIHAQEKQPGLVHRDLKPENILVAQGRWAKITDFGLADIIRQADLELDATGTALDGRQSTVGQKGIAGTPAYMAPEQWRGESLDERADVYALGCMLYEMLTGESPFQVGFRPTTRSGMARWLREMQAQHENSPIPGLPASLPAAPGDLAQSCLAKARAERPSLTELLRQLENLYQGQFATAPRAAPPVGQFTADDHNNRGTAYQALQRYDEALRDYDQAIALSPNDALAYLNLGSLLGNQEMHREALLYFEKATQLGDAQGAQYTAQVKQMLGMAPTPQVDLTQQAFKAFQQIRSAAAMQQALAQFPLLARADFIAIIKQFIAQQIPPERQPAFEQRLAWLRKIANEKQPGSLGRLRKAKVIYGGYNPTRPKPRYQPGDKIGGRYQIHQVLMGGMGKVYLCLDLETIQPYALKTFQQRYQTATQRLRQAFEKEVATWVALDKHPNIVRCFHMETLDNQPFMILEWIAGEESKGADLRGWLRHGPLDLQLALDLSIDVCRGLIHAQEKQPGLVHRDLKPENILVAQGRWAKITDFGLADIIHQGGIELDAAGATLDGRQSTVGHKEIVGTPAYMAPEQWRGESLDERADVYALGCLLYEMLAGETPFQVSFRPIARSDMARWLREMQAQHENSPIPSLPASLPAAPGDLAQSCLAKARAERPSLTELLCQLEDLYQEQFDTAPRAAPPVGQFTAADHNNRGATYRILQRYDEALRDHSRAIELDPNDAPAHSNRGNIYHNLYRYDEALRDHDQAIALNPNYALAYVGRGATYDALRRYDEALRDHDQAIALNPNLAQAYSNRGATYPALRRYDEALRDHDQAIALNPSFALAYSNRGATCVALRRYDEALRNLDQAIALNPNDAQAYSNRGNTYANLQRYDEALRDYDQAIALNPNLAQAYVGRGFTYHNLQRYDDALRDYSRAIALNPNDAKVYNNRGNTYSDLQRYDEALRDYDQAIALNPNFAIIHFNRGNTYHNLQRYDEALRDHDQAIALNPNYALAYGGRGLVYHNLQRYDEALRDYDQAIALNPNFIQAYAGRGDTYAALQRYDEALHDFDQAIALNPNFVQAYVGRGLAYHNLQRYDEALRDYGRAIALNPRYAGVYYNRGNTYAALQRYDEALRDYDQAITLNPKYADAYYNRGNTYAALQRYDEALRDYDQAIALNPNFAQAYVDRGLAYHNLRRYDEALRDYDQAIALNPNFAGAYSNRGITCQALRRYDEALRDHDQAIALNPNLAQAYNNRGNTYQALQRYDEALHDYGRAIALNPNYTDAYCNRGVTYKALQRYDEALRDYDQAIALNPNYADAYNNRGITYQALQRYDEALRDYDQAITLNPNLAQVYSNRGNTYTDLRRYAKALRDYGQAIALNPNFAPAYVGRGATYADLQRYDKALRDYDQAIALNPNYAQAYYNRGITCQALRRYDEALRDFDQAIVLNPDDVNAYNNRGLTYHNLHRYDEALRDYDQAIALNSDDVNAYNNRGNTYKALQRYDEALRDFDQAIVLNPNDADSYSNRGTTYANLQRYDEALRDCRQAIALNPNSALAYANLGALLVNTGRLRESLPYFEKAAQLGEVRGAKYAAQVKKRLDNEKRSGFLGRLFGKQK